MTLHELINRTRADLLRSKSAQFALPRSRLLSFWRLRSYKDFVDFCVQNQCAMCNFGAVIPFVRRIWTLDNTGWIMRISLSGGITAAPRRILFFRVCFRDLLSFNRRMFAPFTRYTAYARVRALRVNSCAEHKQPRYYSRDNVHRCLFHSLSFVTFSQPAAQTDVRGGKFKKDLTSCFAIRPAFSSLLN